MALRTRTCTCERTGSAALSVVNGSAVQSSCAQSSLCSQRHVCSRSGNRSEHTPWRQHTVAASDASPRPTFLLDLLATHTLATLKAHVALLKIMPLERRECALPERPAKTVVADLLATNTLVGTTARAAGAGSGKMASGATHTDLVPWLTLSLAVTWL